MRLLFLTETIPYPLDTGGRIKTFNTLRMLSDAHHVDCHAFIRDDAQRRHAPALAECCQSVTLHLTSRSLRRELQALARASFTGTPYLVQRHVDRTVARRIAAPAAAGCYDAVYCDHLSMLEYGRRLRLPIIYDAHNVEFEIVRRHAATLGWSPLRVAAEAEWRMLRRYERRMLPACRLVYSVSEIDARQLRAMAGALVPVRAVPISIDTAAATYAAPAAAGHEVLFVGGLHWPPNLDAIHNFVRAVFPLVKQRVADAHLTIVGRVSDEQRASLERHGQVTCAGHVPDIEPYFRRSRVMVVPIRAGSGMRVKILDGLARGLPIVTTTIGCEGIAVRPGEHLLVADDDDAFAAATARLLTNPELAASMSARGRALVESVYDVAVVRRQTLEALAAVRWRRDRRPVRIETSPAVTNTSAVKSEGEAR